MESEQSAVQSTAVPKELAAQPFWVKIIIQVALQTVSIFIAANTKLSAAQKSAAQNLLAAGQQFEALL